MKRAAPTRWLPVLWLALVLAGCTTNHYRKSADQETYGAIKEKTPFVRNMDPKFTIEQTNAVALEGLPITTNAQEFLGPYGEAEHGAQVLKLEDALALGVAHSRNYQSRKEQLYLSGLSLTLARHQFAPIFSGNGSVNYSVQTEQAVQIAIDEITTRAESHRQRQSRRTARNQRVGLAERKLAHPRRGAHHGFRLRGLLSLYHRGPQPRDALGGGRHVSPPAAARR
jgi:hypothetical protein